MELASRTKRPSKDSHKSCPLAGYYNNCSIMRTNKRQRETETVQKKQPQSLHLVRSRASVKSNSLIHNESFTSGICSYTDYCLCIY